MSTTTTNRLFFLAAVLGVSCAQVEAEISEAQVTQKNLSFQGVGQWGSLPGDVSAEQSFTLSSDNLSWVKELNSEVYVTQVDFRAMSGVEDLSFIRYAHVTMSDAESLRSPVVVLDYMRPDDQAPTAVLTAKTLYPVDVSHIWKGEKVLVSIALAGTLPDQPWTADVTVHLSGKITYKL